jgi:diacylglycerol O-acyltransferase
MDTIKSAPDATVAFMVLGAMGLASPTIERLGIELFTKKASMLITNVPGPAATVQIAGQDVSSMVVWAPTSGSIGLGFSLLTYAGELRLGVAADANLVSDPRELVALFEREIEAMRIDAGL